MLAGASIALLPVLLIYIFTHKQFIAGLTAGAVKG
jgi:ABC-type glycerol-3-phosphate transport system permease component